MVVAEANKNQRVKVVGFPKTEYDISDAVNEAEDVQDMPTDTVIGEGMRPSGPTLDEKYGTRGRAKMHLPDEESELDERLTIEGIYTASEDEFQKQLANTNFANISSVNQTQAEHYASTKERFLKGVAGVLPSKIGSGLESSVNEQMKKKFPMRVIQSWEQAAESLDPQIEQYITQSSNLKKNLMRTQYHFSLAKKGAVKKTEAVKVLEGELQELQADYNRAIEQDKPYLLTRIEQDMTGTAAKLKGKKRAVYALVKKCERFNHKIELGTKVSERYEQIIDKLQDDQAHYRDTAEDARMFHEFSTAVIGIKNDDGYTTPEKKLHERARDMDTVLESGADTIANILEEPTERQEQIRQVNVGDYVDGIRGRKAPSTQEKYEKAVSKLDDLQYRPLKLV